GAAVKVYTSNFRPMLTALADSPQRSLFKLVCVGEEERVVGIHLLGEAVDEILQGFAVALKLGVTRAQLHDTVAIHPTSAEGLVLACGRPPPDYHRPHGRRLPPAAGRCPAAGQPAARRPPRSRRHRRAHDRRCPPRSRYRLARLAPLRR